MSRCLENVKLQNLNYFQFYFDLNKKALTLVSDISKCIFCVKFSIYMCDYFHVLAIYSDSINSWCRLSVCGVFGRTLVQES